MYFMKNIYYVRRAQRKNNNNNKKIKTGKLKNYKHKNHNKNKLFSTASNHTQHTNDPSFILYKKKYTYIHTHGDKVLLAIGAATTINMYIIIIYNLKICI